VAAERSLRQSIHAQHTEGPPVEVHGHHDAFDHGRARPHAVLDPQATVEVLGEAAGAAADLVGGAADHGFRASGESALRRAVREVDGHHYRDAEGHSENHEAGVQGPPHEVAQAGAKESEREHER
jgi:hypothetical protein